MSDWRHLQLQMDVKVLVAKKTIHRTLILQVILRRALGQTEEDVVAKYYITTKPPANQHLRSLLHQDPL